MSQPRSWIAAVVVAAAITPSPVRADSKNEIRAVTFDEDAGTTRVHVQGAQTPTFTVYKLERPSRVVIDVPQARLGEALHCQPYTFAAQRIATPIVHMIQHAHAAPKAGFVAPRSFGIE